MPKPLRRRRWPLALALVALSGSAGPWTAYGEPPAAAPAQQVTPAAEAPQRPAPGVDQFPSMPLPGYAIPGYDMPPPLPPPAAGYGGYPGGSRFAEPGAGRVPRPATGLTDIDQSMTEDGYILDVALDGIEPSQVEVGIFGRALVVRTRRAMETRREEAFDDGRGIARSYSWSSGSSARRFPVPPDADLGGLSREDSTERVRITIPRASTDTAPPAERAEQ